MCGAGGAARCTCVCAPRGCVCTRRPCVCAHRRASPLTCLAVCFLVLTYNLLGGFLFLALEGAPETETAVAASTPQLGGGAALRARAVERLWAITEDLNILYKDNWTRLAARELSDFQAQLAQSLHAPSAGGRGGGGGQGEHHQPQYRWTFATSFLYALTLITTIGPGEMAPQSEAGRLVALGYACVGIPLVLLYLGTAGGALARGVRGGYARLRPAAPPPPTPPLGSRPRLPALAQPVWPCRPAVRVPVPLPLTLLALYVLLGALVFRCTERWSLLDGCYFAFSTLATIGFGGLRPGLRAAAVSARAEDIAIGACCVYILVGMVVVATCFTLVQEEVRAAFRGVTGLCAGRGEPVHTLADTHIHATTQSEKPVEAVS